MGKNPDYTALTFAIILILMTMGAYLYGRNYQRELDREDTLLPLIISK